MALILAVTTVTFFFFSIYGSIDCEIQYLLATKPGKHYLMMDTSKLDSPSLVSYNALKDFDSVIMDKKPTQKYIDFFNNNNVELIYNGE